VSDNAGRNAPRSLPIKGSIGLLAPAEKPAGTLSIPAVDDRLIADVTAAYAPNTLRAYAADWRDWLAWCERHHHAPMPAAPAAVRDYLTDLAAAKKVGTLRRRLAAIAQAHEIAKAPFDRHDPAIRFSLKRLARERGEHQAGRRELMTRDIVAMLGVIPATLRGTRDRAILLVGFATGMRRSELVEIKVNDLDWRRDGVMIRIARSKGDQEGRGQSIGVVYGKREATCPVRALKRWLAESAIADGPILRGVARGKPTERRLSDKIVWRIVKRYAEQAGIDPAQLGAHSLRVGHATQSIANGAAPHEAQQQLRHRRLETTLRYNRGRSFKGNSSGKLDL